MRILAGTSRILLAATLALAAACPRPATAQLDPLKTPADKPASPGSASEPAPSGLREVKPETFYLIDKDGKLVPYFDIPYEEFRRLYLLDRKLKAPDQPPRFSLQQMTAVGGVEGNQATLDISFKILLNESGWTRVPLRLNNALLTHEIQTEVPEGSPKQFVEYDRGTDGYVGWLQGEKGTSQVIQLKLLVPLEQTAGESRLALQAPRALSAELRLKVPVVGAVCDPIGGVIVQPPRNVEKGTEFNLLGLSGDVTLSWHEGREQPAQAVPILEANGVTTIRFEGQSHISAEARLKVRGLNGPFDSFRVRLPAGMKLIPVSQPKYVVSVVEIKEPKKPAVGGTPESQIVEVKLAGKTSDSVEVTLLAETSRAAAAADMLWEAAGFDVLGAVGQWGYVDLTVEGDWSLNWFEGPQVQRVPEPAEGATRQAVLARFEYSRQPYSLQVQVLPKRTRVSVEPSYVVQVDPAQVRLEARLKYKVRGAKAYSIDVDLTGWKIDPNGFSPANLVQFDALSLEQVSPLKIPLSSLAQTTGGEFELRLAAYREAKAGEKLTFTLPRPVASTLSPATLAVLPADNVELTPLAAELSGLTPEALPPLIKLPARQQAPLFYRDRSEGGPGVFAGQFKIRKGSVTIKGSGRIQFDERSVRIEQRLMHRIAFEPLTELVVDAPRASYLADSLKFELDGEPLVAVDVADDVAGLQSATRRRVRLALKGERIGPCELVATFTIPLPALETGKETPLVIPLVIPTSSGESTTLTTNSLTVTNPNTLRLDGIGTPWTPYEDAEELESGEGRKLFAPVDTAEVRLVGTLLQPRKRGTTSVSQAWLQTWLTAGDRRDRAVFRITTSDGRVRIQLPPGARTSDLELALNGHRITAPRVSAVGQVEIELPAGTTQREAVVELWYSFQGGRPPRGGLAVEPPQIVNSPWTGRWYWQLVTPRTEHVVLSPAGMTPELTWQWQGMGWGRQASLNQEDLEKWIGASSQPPLPAAVNSYLYSSFGTVERLQVQTAGRALLLLIVSGTILFGGLLLIYLPWLRHPALLLLVAVAVLSGGLFEPELALQLAQVATVGLALLLAARIMHWMFGRRRENRAIVHGSSLFGLDHSADSRPSRRDVDPRVSTATAPLSIPVSAAEGQP